MPSHFWWFLVIWFILCIIILRLVKGMINGYIMWAQQNIPFLGGDNKKSPGIKEIGGQILAQMAPTIGELLTGKLKEWAGKGGQK